jgi:hypothetical protein
MLGKSKEIEGKIEKGDLVEDRITGLRGVVVGMTRCIYRCDRVSVRPLGSKDGKPFEMLTDDPPGLKLLKKGELVETVLAKPDNGCGLGDLVRDKISGMEGVVVSITDWLFDSLAACVQPVKLTGEGRMAEVSGISLQQLTVLEKRRIDAGKIIDAKPEEAPKRTGSSPVARRQTFADITAPSVGFRPVVR